MTFTDADGVEFRGTRLVPGEVKALQQLETEVKANKNNQHTGRLTNHDKTGEFYGFVVENHHVTRILLRDAGIKDLPCQLFSFPRLKEIDLTFNDVESVPDGIDQLTNLEELTIDSCLLRYISSDIGRLNNLRTLVLGGRRKLLGDSNIELPGSIGNLKNLGLLNLSGLNFTSIPGDFQKLTALETFTVEDCYFDRLPNIFQDMTQLHYLDISRAYLPEVPRFFNHLTRLQTLRLRYDKIIEIPEIFSGMKALQSLLLDGNRIEVVPESIGDLESLIDLNLSTNRITQLPLSLGRLKNLEKLRLDRNLLSRLPEILGELKKLRNLFLEGNQFQEFPAPVLQAPKLRNLLLQKNHLQAIPETIGKISSLRLLDLRDNKLNSLPEMILNIKGLQSVLLAGNLFDDIPNFLKDKKIRVDIRVVYPITPQPSRKYYSFSLCVDDPDFQPTRDQVQRCLALLHEHGFTPLDLDDEQSVIDLGEHQSESIPGMEDESSTFVAKIKLAMDQYPWDELDTDQQLILPVPIYLKQFNAVIIKVAKKFNTKVGTREGFMHVAPDGLEGIQAGKYTFNSRFEILGTNVGDGHLDVTEMEAIQSGVLAMHKSFIADVENTLEKKVKFVIDWDE